VAASSVDEQQMGCRQLCGRGISPGDLNIALAEINGGSGGGLAGKLDGLHGGEARKKSCEGEAHVWKFG